MNTPPACTSSAKEKVPLSTRIAFGAGGFSSAFIMQVFFILVYPIYQVGLGMNPAWLGWALAAPRLLDFFIDPLIGNFSDNIKTRWGRRRPLILGGAGFCAVILPLLWMPPTQEPRMMLAYFVAMSCVYTLGYATFEVPYTGLGYELTDDYDERTRVLAWRMYMGLAGILISGWALKLCFLPIFGGNEVKGAPWVSGGISLLILLGAVVTCSGVREKSLRRQPEVRVLEAIRLTFTNRPFVKLMVVNLIVRVGIVSIGPIAYYINAYEVCRLPDFQASKEFAAKISGWSVTLVVLASYASLPAAAWLSKRGSKRFSMVLCLAVAALGSASFWFTFDARWPYLQLVSAVVSSAAMNGVWLLMSSMVADICDEDQLRTGMRREGVFGASYSVVEKLAGAAATSLGGWLLLVLGYNAQRALAGDVAPEIIFRMKAIYVFAQCGALLVAIWLIASYPLTRARAAEVRRLLEEKESL
ncbi:MAG: MFS transporter [Verrucomicrobiota bacterium]